MNFKLNTKTAAFILAFMMIDSVPALAGTVVLSGGASNTCSSYTGFNVDANGNLTVTCADTGPAPTPTAPPSCTLNASPATINQGSSTTLIASCSPAASTFAWTGINFSGSGGSVNPSSTTSYSVSGTNNIGTGNTATVVVTVSTSNQEPGNGPKATPTSKTPVEEIKRWNRAFSVLNSLALNFKWEPLGQMDYYKRIRADKPTQFHMPTSW